MIMNIVEVLVQHPVFKLNRPFSYLCDEEVVVGTRVTINFNQQEIVGYVLSVTATTKSKDELEKEHGYEYKYIAGVIDKTPILNEELMALSEQVASYYYAPHISVLHAMLPPSLRPNRSGMKGAKIAYDKYFKINENHLDISSLTAKQLIAFNSIKEAGELLKKEISAGIAKTLLEKGFIIEVLKEKHRLKLPVIEGDKAPKLTLEQQNAVNAIFYGDQSTYLLEGVTGSGKTEVYLKLAEKTLEAGKNVLFLVPEIALTPRMVSYFIKRFNQKVSLFHSELTAAEKYDEYRRIASGEVRIVVGARSSIFVPLSNIGLIIIDEEHSATYKQETPPYYHVLTVAEMRAKFYNTKIVLGSATPSLESKSRAQKGIYGHVTLKTRFNRQELPNTMIVNMLDNRNVSKKSVYFSNQLLSGIEETLAKGEQAILLVNRRGYGNYITCRACGYVARCPECGLSLIYHKKDEQLHCHHCDHIEPMFKECPECHSHHIKVSGFGTERAIEQLQKLFPTAKLLRLDSDVAKKQEHLTKILGDFAAHKADILVGTQMIAKGHDFPKVTLVGVLSADAGLAIPSFRSSETTFQLLMQAIGRSGRSQLVGRAIVQTTLPTHYAIVDASRQNYQAFYETELRYRHLTKMPPFTYLLQIKLSGRDEDKVEETTLELKNSLNEVLKDDVDIIGPSIPIFQPIKNIHERNLIVKYTNYFKIKPKLMMLLRPLMENSQFSVKINIDPFDI